MITVPSVLALFAAAGLASGQALSPTNYYNVPSGILAGTLSQQVNCTTTLNGASLGVSAFTITLGGALSSTITASGSAVLVGRAVVASTPAYASSLARLGVTQFNGTVVQTVINAAGSTAGSFDVAKTNSLTIPNTTVTSGQPLVLNIPGTSQSALSIGPITPSSGAITVSYSIGAAQVNVTAILGGKPVPVVVKCPAVTPVRLLAFSSVGGSSFTSASGLDLPPTTNTANSSLIGTAGSTYTCTVSGVSGTLSVPFSITAYSTDLTVRAGGNYVYQNGHGIVNVTQATSNALLATFSGTKPTAFRLTLNSLFAYGTNLANSPIKLNAAPAVGDIIQLSSTTGTYLARIPGGSALLPNITLTAGSAGTTYTYLGNASVTIDTYNSAGTIVKTFTGTCAQPANPAVPILPITVF